MCNFLQEKHRLKLSLSVKHNFQALLSKGDDGSCGHFVVEELICKAHFNDIKNLPMKEHILLCKYILTRKPIIINVNATAAGGARNANLCTDYIYNMYIYKWEGFEMLSFLYDR